MVSLTKKQIARKRFYQLNPEREKAKTRAYYEANKEKCLAYSKLYRLKNRETVLKKQAEWQKKNPWSRSYFAAKYRCENKNHKAFPDYGLRGIKFGLTLEDIKFLWIRDNAAQLKRASLDRIDSKGNYALPNCRFIEHSENCRLGAISRWARG